MMEKLLNVFKDISTIFIAERPSGDERWSIRLIPENGKVKDVIVHELLLNRQVSSFEIYSISTLFSSVAIKFKYPTTLYLRSYNGEVWLQNY